MIGFPFLFALSVLSQALPVRDSLLHTLTTDELKLYSLTVRDVVSSTPARLLSGQTAIALDPILRRAIGSPANPWSGVHLAIPSLGALLQASGLRRFCEPADYNACRGSIRGLVLRLQLLCPPLADSVQIVLTLTTARAERDNTALMPQARYYVYDLVRQNGAWRLRHARRDLAAWVPSLTRSCS
jgi:hypothetical protein